MEIPGADGRRLFRVRQGVSKGAFVAAVALALKKKLAPRNIRLNVRKGTLVSVPAFSELAEELAVAQLLLPLLQLAGARGDYRVPSLALDESGGGNRI